jgi:hypothetical protein
LPQFTLTESRAIYLSQPFGCIGVSLVQFHVAPLSILEEIERRMTEGVAVGVLVREYWAPTGTWYLERAQLL